MHKRMLAIIVIAIMVLSGLSVLVSNVHSSDQLSSNNSNALKVSSHIIGKNVLPTNSPEKKSQKSSAISSSARASALSNIQKIESGIKNGSLKSKDIYLPNLNTNVSTVNGHVSPEYSSAPAPMGIGDFGLKNQSGTLVPYNLSTTAFIGSITINSSKEFYPASQDPNSYSIQLNTVLNNVTLNGNSSYTFWTQNVAFFSTKTDQLTLIDNVWNFTGADLGQNTIISGNGTNLISYYYSIGPTFNVSSSFKLTLYLTTSDINGQNAVYFSYNILSQNGNHKGTYDTVVFNSTYGAPPGYSAPVAHFLVSGSDITPLGTLNDAELILGGPGGGSEANFYNLSGTMQLQYYDNGKYLNAPSSYDYGTDTGETSYGVAVGWSNDGVATLTNGPSLLYGMWNISGIKTMQTYSGQITPSNSFFFVNPGASYNISSAAWVPLPVSGDYYFVLPSMNYEANVSLSDYDSEVYSLSSYQTVSLSENLFTGIYTPLYEFGNSQLQYISVSGNGAESNPYVIFNGTTDSPVHSLSPIYGLVNDYSYPLFYGVLFSNENKYVDMNGLPLLYYQYEFFNKTLTDMFYNTQYLAIWNSRDKVSNCNYYPDLEMINPEHDLIGNNTFIGGFTQLYIDNGQYNYIWGNHFIGNESFSVYFGIELSDSGDNTIYNNYFYGMSIPANSYGTPFLESNSWYIHKEPSTYTSDFLGYQLTGSIIGLSYQGGNYWWNFDGSVPFYSFYQISSGDYVPLVAPNLITFHETGLPYAWDFSAVLNNTYIDSFNYTNSGYTTLNLLNGTYNYSISDYDTSYIITNNGCYSPSVSYIPSVSSAQLKLTGENKEINVNYKPEYLVEFTSNVPYGVKWWVNLSNGESFNSTSPYINFYEPNGTYSWIASTSSSNKPSGTFKVQGTYENEYAVFNNIVSQIEFTEVNLPSGTSWSVLVNGTIYSSNTANIYLKLSSGDYNFHVYNASGYLPFPSDGIFSVAESHLYIGFESPSSQKLGYFQNTLNPVNGHYEYGSNVDLSGEANNTLFSAIDTSDGYLFSTVYMETDNGVNYGISIINTTSNSLVKMISLGSENEAFFPVYDSYTGNVYVTDFNFTSDSGSIYTIQGSTLSVVSKLSLGNDIEPTFLTADSRTGNIYIANDNNYNISIMNVTTDKITGSIQLPAGNLRNIHNAALGTGQMAFDNSQNLLYATSSGNLSVINPVTNQILREVSMGNNSTPIDPIVDIASDRLFVLSEHGNMTIFNLSTLAKIYSVHISDGLYFSGLLDPSNNMVYAFQVSPYYIYNSNRLSYIYDVSSDGSVVGLTPDYAGIGYGGSINLQSQNIYVTGLSGIYDLKVPYSISDSYTVTFTENGLPSGSQWYVNISNGDNLTAITSSISLNLANGTYSYSAASVKDYSVSNMVGSFTVRGSSVNVILKYNRDPHIKLSVSPSGALIFINGLQTGTGSLSEFLAQGYYYINVTDPGYAGYTNYVYLSNDNNYSFTVSLTKVNDAGYLSGTVSPGSASVIANGIIIPVIGGHFNASLLPGTYFVSVTANGFSSVVQEFNITAGKTSTFNPTLTPITNSVTLSGFINPSGSSLAVDGFLAYVNATGYYSISVPAGSYTISVLDSGYYPLSENLTLSTSKMLNFTLTKEPKATSTEVLNSTTASGYNVMVSNLSTGNGEISIAYNSTGNGIIIVQIPFTDMKNATISEILNSTVYINGVSYSDYSISISSNYTIILKVSGLKSGDPNLYWKYSPDAVIPVPSSPSKVSQPSSLIDYEVLGAIIGAAIIVGALVMVFGKRRK